MKAFSPAKYDERIMHAVKNLARGEANESQQRCVLDWIINEVAKTYDVSFRPEGDRDTCFAEGRRFVGLQIVKLINMEPEHD